MVVERRLGYAADVLQEVPMRWIPLAGLVLAFSTAEAAPVPKHLMKNRQIDPTKLVGKWTPKEKPELGTLEFTRDGKIVMEYPLNGETHRSDGVYKVEKDELTETFDRPGGSQPLTLVISELTDTDLVLIKKDGVKWPMVRVKGK
ncbi:hypothetical protein R5W23_001259 [Gemmata sp. JC673]|uniref:TIGR03067 domain-containing protein n=1 Tax=Gemmata algarum TaxID=2975278 RepID=A0ABU5F278_9BACT|nr:hypothetical protein [Gemmata algarum]MDY3560036.1 hypothetical protein [Gemmata algarum]